MNKRVIKTLIGLTIAYLVAWYILKIFFPEKFILQVNNERLIAIGNYIDSHFILNKLLGAVFSYATYWLYLCSVCKIKKLNWKQSIIVVCVYIASFLIQLIDIQLATYYNIIAMISLPALFNGNLKSTAFVFSFHLICQWLSLSIRGLSTHILCMNTLTVFVMSLECYFWLFLFYVYFNYYEKGE